LSHEERDDVRGAYNRAQWLPERVKLMQWWADRLQTFRHKDAPSSKVRARRASRKAVVVSPLRAR
jgi:hypothetical protein